MGILDKQIDTVTGFYPMVPLPSGGGSTTLSALAAKGATSLSLTAATNFAIGDDILIGTGETQELGKISNLVSTTVTLETKLLFDHPSADPVVEAGALNIGNPEADGVKVNLAMESTDTFDVISKLPFGAIQGYGDINVGWRFLTVSADIFALALGLPRSEIVGDGTNVAQTGTAGPRTFSTDGVLMGALINFAMVVTARLVDGTHVRLVLNGLSMNPTVMTTTFSRGQLATVPCEALATSYTFGTYAGAFTPANVINTYATTEDDQFAEMLAVYELSDSGTATTTNGSTAAGAYSIISTSASGFAAGDWVRAGNQFHRVQGISTNTLNLHTKVREIIPTGTPLVKQTKTDCGAIAGGFTTATPGTVTKKRSETRRLSLRNKVGNIGAQFSFNVSALTPENLQRAWALPASAYDTGVTSVTSDTLARQLRRTFLFQGLTQGGKTVEICGWRGTAQPGGEMVLSQAADWQLPVVYKPKVVQVIVNS